MPNAPDIYMNIDAVNDWLMTWITENLQTDT